MQLVVYYNRDSLNCTFSYYCFFVILSSCCNIQERKQERPHIFRNFGENYSKRYMAFMQEQVFKKEEKQ